MESEPDFEMPTTFLRGIGISVRLLGRDRLLFFAHAQNGVVVAALSRRNRSDQQRLIGKGVRC